MQSVCYISRMFLEASFQFKLKVSGAFNKTSNQHNNAAMLTPSYIDTVNMMDIFVCIDKLYLYTL